MIFLEPTADECTKNARVLLYKSPQAGTRYGYACWYPQMGGYTSKCVIVFDEPQTNNSCFDAYVWGNGDWPFHDGEPPRELHHCDARQFIRFGEMVLAKQAKHGGGQ